MLSLVLFPQVSTPVSALTMPGVWEWVVILGIVLVVFGPGKLPQLGESLGKSIRGFKKAMNTDPNEIDVTPSSGQLPEGQAASIPKATQASEDRTVRN